MLSGRRSVSVSAFSIGLGIGDTTITYPFNRYHQWVQEDGRTVIGISWQVTSLQLGAWLNQKKDSGKATNGSCRVFPSWELPLVRSKY
jgi:hypothetical protein